MKRSHRSSDGHLMPGAPRRACGCQTCRHRFGAPLVKARGIVADLLAALEFIVNDVPEPGEDAQLTTEGYNRACRAIAKARGQ